MQVTPSADHALWSLNLVQVTESISGSVVPLAMFLFWPPHIIFLLSCPMSLLHSAMLCVFFLPSAILYVSINHTLTSILRSSFSHICPKRTTCDNKALAKEPSCPKTDGININHDINTQIYTNKSLNYCWLIF